MGYIYRIIEKETGNTLYVGSTKREPSIRKSEHFKNIEKKKHKIKKLNEYNVDELGFEVLMTLTTDNSLILNMSEMLWNSVLHPINKCVIQGFRGSTVTLARCDKDKAKIILDSIKNEYGDDNGK